MKNIIDKIYIHPITYFLILSACITGMFKELIILALIIITHELGHLLIILKYKYKITKIEFYPFGGIIKHEKDINTPIREEIILSTSGVFFQLVLAIIIFMLYNFDLVRYQFLSTFMSYNIILLIFNLLPVIPLDGHILFKSILEKYFSFKQSFVISAFISGLILMSFIWINIRFNLNNYIIIGFLFYKLYESLKRFKYIRMRFYLERILKDYEWNKIKIINKIRIDKMMKEKTHYFLESDKFIPERAVLSKKFDITHNI